MATTSSDGDKAAENVLMTSEPIDATKHGVVAGYDLNKGVDYEAILNAYVNSGFQATNYGLAVAEINRMLDAKLSPFVLPDGSFECFDYPEGGRKKTGCTIFLGYTSNLISAGLRETIRFLVQHNLVDCIVTSAGGIEEDLIKCLAPTYVGAFDLPGAELRKKGHNRIGNLLVPNSNYCLFEDWLMPIFDACVAETKTAAAAGDADFNWTPSKLVDRLGKEIKDETSVCYWAHKNRIPIFCPALTDGSLGDMLYMHSYRDGGLRLDIVEDLRHLNSMAVRSVKTGSLILGGGLVKHHINNANLMRNGADYCVYINTSSEFDGSDGGARPDEAVSWGKIRIDAKPVKITADATLVFPLIAAQTFAKRVNQPKIEK